MILTPIVLRVLGAAKSDEKSQKFHDRETIKLNIGGANRDSEITELEHHLLELKQYILKWSKQDIEKSHEVSDDEHPPRSLL